MREAAFLLSGLWVLLAIWKCCAVDGKQIAAHPKVACGYPIAYVYKHLFDSTVWF